MSRPVLKPPGQHALLCPFARLGNGDSEKRRETVGLGDVIVSCHSVACGDREPWRTGTPYIRLGHNVWAQDSPALPDPRASAAGSWASPRPAPSTSPVILGMPSSRGTGSRTMTPWSVPTQSRPWQIRRLVTHRCFWPAERGQRERRALLGGRPNGLWGGGGSSHQIGEMAQSGSSRETSKELDRAVPKTWGLGGCPGWGLTPGSPR